MIRPLTSIKPGPVRPPSGAWSARWIGLVVDRDPNQAGPLLDAVVVRVGCELAAAIDGNAAFVEVEGGDSGGVSYKDL
jgi:hypothetical protein